MTLWQRVLRLVMEALRRVTGRTAYKNGGPQRKEGDSRSTSLEKLLNVYVADIMEVYNINTFLDKRQVIDY